MTDTPHRNVWTIGHSIHPIEDFLALVAHYKIQTVIDIRRFPFSRRHPQFNSQALDARLKSAGIEYTHFPELGGRREPLENSRNTALRNSALRGYADHMESDEFRAGIQHLHEFIDRKKTAMMCAEALWKKCHRSILSDYLTANGIEVTHILSIGATEQHTYSSSARMINGQLTYRKTDLFDPE